jgi:hypothetical protein
VTDKAARATTTTNRRRTVLYYHRRSTTERIIMACHARIRPRPCLGQAQISPTSPAAALQRHGRHHQPTGRAPLPSTSIPAGNPPVCHCRSTTVMRPLGLRYRR